MFQINTEYWLLPESFMPIQVDNWSVLASI